MSQIEKNTQSSDAQRAARQTASAMEQAAGMKFLEGRSKARFPFNSFKMPRVKQVAETRNELPKILRAVEQGETFLIKGPSKREALIMNADLFRELQESYLKLLGELETRKILENDEARKSLDAALQSDDYVTLSQVEERYGIKQVDAEEDRDASVS
jgi:hypothetical protein